MKANTLSLRELEVLRTLMDRRTTTAAATHLGMSQSAISRSLSHLEDQLGYPLFLREGGRLTPTPEARSVDAELDTIFAALRRIEAKGDDLPEAAPPLRLAAPPTLAHNFLVEVVSEFAHRYPGQKISVDVSASDVLMTYVAERRLDLAIVDSAPHHAGVQAEAFRASDLVYVMRRDHPLAARQVIRPLDLDGLPFISQARRHGVRAAQDEVFSEAGVFPAANYEVGTVTLAAEMAQLGHGVALIDPFPTALHLDAMLCMRPFAPRVTMQTWFMTPSSVRPTPATVAFMALVREASGQAAPALADKDLCHDG